MEIKINSRRLKLNQDKICFIKIILHKSEKAAQYHLSIHLKIVNFYCVHLY